MEIYKKINNSIGNLQNIKKQDPTYPLWIPIEPENRDYQDYLEWVAEGNTPEEADDY